MTFRVGVAAMGLSALPWLGLPILPLLDLSNGARAGAAGALVIAAEILFWGGLALAGRDTWQAVRRAGWRRAPGELWRLLRHGRRDRRAPIGGPRAD